MKKLLACMLLAVLAFPGFAGGEREADESYPTRPVEIIVPWAAGGGSDTIARALLTVMGQYFPQPMVVINRPGGGGTVGTTYALNQRPDGYTVLLTAWGPMITQPVLDDMEYGPDDYEPVLQISYEPRILVGHPDVPYDDIKGMIEYAQQNPGDVLVGIADVGTTDHFAFLELELEYNADFTLTPQGGGGPARVALLGQHIDVSALVAGEAAPLIEAGELKPLGVMGPDRYGPLPEIPTTAEYGIPVESASAVHLYVPAGVPEARVAMIHDAFKNAMHDEAFLQLAARLGRDTEYLDGSAVQDQVSRFLALYGRIADDYGLRN